MGKIYAIVNQKNEYYNDWNDSFIKKINQDILYFDLKCAESILKNLNDRDDMYCDGCKIVELTICPKQQISDLEAKLAKNRKWLASNEGFLENQKLKQQLADKEKEHELLINQFEEETEKLRKQIKQESDARKRFIEAKRQLEQQLLDKEEVNKCNRMAINALKQQLENKEKEITVLKEVIDKNKTGNFTSENVCNAISKFYEPLLKQLQNQTAIAELETLKCEFEKYEKVFKLRPIDVYNIIDQQIKSLKGDADEERKTNNAH